MISFAVCRERVQVRVMPKVADPICNLTFVYDPKDSWDAQGFANPLAFPKGPKTNGSPKKRQMYNHLPSIYLDSCYMSTIFYIKKNTPCCYRIFLGIFFSQTLGVFGSTGCPHQGDWRWSCSDSAGFFRFSYRKKRGKKTHVDILGKCVIRCTIHVLFKFMYFIYFCVFVDPSAIYWIILQFNGNW